MGYRNILWVDDGEKNTSRFAPQGMPEQYGKLSAFGSEYENRVHHCKSFNDAVDVICSENLTQYDTVVLDLDLTNNKNEKLPRDKLNEYGINIDADNGKQDSELLQNGGYYLYLLLLNRGFPFSRILILTAHGDGTEQKSAKNRFLAASLNVPSAINKNEPSEFQNCLNKLYKTPDCFYYKIREMVFNACAECESMIQSENSVEDIAYNRLVNDDKKIDFDGIKILFDNIRHQLSWHKPTQNDLFERYKNILRLLSEPFEANYSFDNVENDLTVKAWLYEQRECFKTMKLFRNWMTHGLLKSDKLDDVKFLFLFIIAFHALFGLQSNPQANSSNTMITGNIPLYEDEIITLIERRVNLDSANNHAEQAPKFISNNPSQAGGHEIRNILIELYNKLSNNRFEPSILSTSYHDMLTKLGNKSNKGFQGKYILILAMVCLYPIEKTSLHINQNFNVILTINDKILHQVLGNPVSSDSDFMRRLRSTSRKYLNYSWQ